MKVKDIVRGKRYETELGNGTVEYQPTARNVSVFITDPIPRGRCNMLPRDVFRELPPRETPTCPAL